MANKLILRCTRIECNGNAYLVAAKRDILRLDAFMWIDW